MKFRMSCFGQHLGIAHFPMHVIYHFDFSNLISDMNCDFLDYYYSNDQFGLFMPLFQNIPNEWAKGVLDGVDNLTEETIDEVIKEFVKDFKEGTVEAKGWPTFLSAYMVSKAAMNSYTRILARRYPNMCINCVCPGFVKTDMNRNCGTLSVEDGAWNVVRLALFPNGSPSGLFFACHEVSNF